MYNAVVFIDRDGVINEDNGYVSKIEDFKFISGSIFGIRKLNRNKCKTFVVTNQSGIARGFYSDNDVRILHDHMINEMLKYNAFVDHIYYCPDLDSYNRKPEPGMLNAALMDLNVNPNMKLKKYIIGDKLTDMIAGSKVGCKKILVSTGCGPTEVSKIKTLLETPDYLAHDLLDASYYIIDDMKKN